MLQRSMVLPAAAAMLLFATPALAASRTYDLPPFDSVAVSAGITALIEAGGDQAVSAEAESDAVLNRLSVRVREGRLEIGLDQNLLEMVFSFGQRDPITVRVSAPALKAVEASSGANADARNLAGPAVTFEASSGASVSATGVSGEGVTVESSSGARIVVEGTCGALVAETSSGAGADTQKLVCASVEASVSSGGRLEVTATESIKAEASSGGGITVHGQPARTSVESSSGGSVTFAP